MDIYKYVCVLICVYTYVHSCNMLRVVHTKPYIMYLAHSMHDKNIISIIILWPFQKQNPLSVICPMQKPPPTGHV